MAGLSVDSVSSTRSCSPIDLSQASSEDMTGNLKQYLEDFSKRRRSSMYMRHIQKQIDEYFSEGHKKPIIDVTSPGITVNYIFNIHTLTPFSRF